MAYLRRLIMAAWLIWPSCTTQSDTFYKSFEIPLLEKFDSYKQEVQDRQLTYEKETGAKSKMIRDTEAENMRAGRKKQRGTRSLLAGPLCT